MASPDVLRFRITLESAETLFARAKMLSCVNSTKWRSHPPGTLRIKQVFWIEDGGRFTLYTDIERSDGKIWARVPDGLVSYMQSESVEFNDFDFGQQLFPEHQLN